ncbi:putative transcription factor MBF1 family [Helianthus anomalus]
MILSFSIAAAAGSNKAVSTSTSLNTRKLDEETENLTHEKVPTELKKAIIQGRTEKKLTQAQLAQVPCLPFPTLIRFMIITSEPNSFYILLQHINEKPQIIQEYESGKVIPNQQFLINMKKV